MSISEAIHYLPTLGRVSTEAELVEFQQTLETTLLDEFHPSDAKELLSNRLFELLKKRALEDSDDIKTLIKYANFLEKQNETGRQRRQLFLLSQNNTLSLSVVQKTLYPELTELNKNKLLKKLTLLAHPDRTLHLPNVIQKRLSEAMVKCRQEKELIEAIPSTYQDDEPEDSEVPMDLSPDSQEDMVFPEYILSPEDEALIPTSLRGKLYRALKKEADEIRDIGGAWYDFTDHEKASIASERNLKYSAHWGPASRGYMHNNEQDALLAEAAISGDVKQIITLSKQVGFNVNSWSYQNENGMGVRRGERRFTPLMWALDHGRHYAAELLIKLGANIHHKDCYGTHMVFFAKDALSLKILFNELILRETYLEEIPALLLVANPRGETLLEILLERLYSGVMGGYTSLSLSDADKPFVKKLFELAGNLSAKQLERVFHGATLSAPMWPSEKRPAGPALLVHLGLIEKPMLAKREDEDKALVSRGVTYINSRFNDTGIVRQLKPEEGVLVHKSDLETKEKIKSLSIINKPFDYTFGGSTPLSAAILKNDERMVNVAFAHGASLYARDGEGNTPLLDVLFSVLEEAFLKGKNLFEPKNSYQLNSIISLLVSYKNEVFEESDSAWDKFFEDTLLELFWLLPELSNIPAIILALEKEGISLPARKAIDQILEAEAETPFALAKIHELPFATDPALSTILICIDKIISEARTDISEAISANVTLLFNQVYRILEANKLDEINTIFHRLNLDAQLILFRGLITRYREKALNHYPQSQGHELGAVLTHFSKAEKTVQNNSGSLQVKFFSALTFSPRPSSTKRVLETIKRFVMLADEAHTSKETMISIFEDEAFPKNIGITDIDEIAATKTGVLKKTLQSAINALKDNEEQPMEEIKAALVM